MKQRQGYTNTMISIPDIGGWGISADCADITFFNYGATDLIVNDVLIVPAPSIAGQFTFVNISGNTGEIDKTIYKCRYAGSGEKKAVAIRRCYTD